MKTSKELLSSFHLGDKEATGIIRGITVYQTKSKNGNQETLLSLRFLIDTEDTTRITYIDPPTFSRLSKKFGHDLANWFGREIQLHPYEDDTGKWSIKISPAID